MRLSRQLITALFLLAAILPAIAQPGQRLILKDGTYQVYTKYEVKGQVVRFFSAERDEWEEIPSALVDWPATARWNHDRAAGASPSASADSDSSDPGKVEAAKIDAEERAARDEEMARMPMISPGLHLPDESGVWVLDTFRGDPELIHVMQANGDLNRASEHSVLRASVNNSGAKELIRMEGAEAKVQVHVDQPVLFISLDRPGGPAENPPPESALTVDTHGASSAVKDKNSHSSPDSTYAILRVNSVKNLRTVAATEVSLLGQSGHSEDIIETTKQILPGGRWMKITPKIPLLIGEYALIEILSPHEVNLDVWAFGVNPRALENKNARMPLDAGP